MMGRLYTDIQIMLKSRKTMPEQASGSVDSEPLEMQETIINEDAIKDNVV